MCCLFQSLFVLLNLLFVLSSVLAGFSIFLTVVCVISLGRLAAVLQAARTSSQLFFFVWERLEVGLPALEQRLQQQQKAVEDLGAALEET